MDRRHFLASSLVPAAATAVSLGSALGASSALASSSAPGDPRSRQGGVTTAAARQYYALRRYDLRTGPQKKLTDDYLKNAFIPALNRLGVTPVGVFNVSIGVGGPSMYVLTPGNSAEVLLTAEAKLSQDADYLKAAGDFLNAPAKEPAYERLEISLMQALESAPTLTVPEATASHGARVFELRTYESSSDLDHQRKVEQMNAGEVGIFVKSGFWPIFFGDTLIGTRMPNVTYMIGFESLAERDKHWNAFFTAPETRTLFGNPRYTFEGIVANVNNSILTPTPYSQI
jgi:NIPSNAP